MEHVRGRTLAELVAAGPLEPAAVLKVARQVAEALADAHEHGIVHRDVKPGNVMVDERGQVKVLDFGLARFAPPAADDSATWSGEHGALAGAALAGTLAYMSPEQVRGGSLDGRSDVFSLGVVLYELLSGARPFRGENAIALIDAILHATPPPLAPWTRSASAWPRWSSSCCRRTPRVGPPTCARSAGSSTRSPRGVPAPLRPKPRSPSSPSRTSPGDPRTPGSAPGSPRR